MQSIPASHPALAAPDDRTSLQVVITQGSQTGTTVPLDHFPFIVGRDLRSDLRRLDVQVSRLHCLFRMQHGRVSVEDMGSRNGTMANSRKIANATLLAAGDLLIVGRTTLRIEGVRPELMDSAREETTQAVGQTLMVSSPAEHAFAMREESNIKKSPASEPLSADAFSTPLFQTPAPST